MKTRDYLSKIQTHLQYHNRYKSLIHNITSAIANDARFLIQYMHSQHIIDETTMDFLLPPKNTCTSLFYGFPKIHKPDCPLGSVVSGCDGPTYHLSAYITHFMQPLASNIPSHLKTQNVSSALSKNFDPSHPIPSWSQLASHPYTQTSHTKTA